MTHVTTAARAAASALITALAVAALTLVGAPAHAADAVLSGITYSEIDPADPSAGAIVTGYDSSAHPGHPAVTIPDQVEIDGDLHDVVEIGDEAFFQESIASVDLPQSLVRIGDSAFRLNDLTEVDFPLSLEWIGTLAFAANEIGQVTLPQYVAVVQPSAFYDNAITSIGLSPAMTLLRSGVFGANALTDVTIPASITQIQNEVFTENPSLDTVTFHGPAPEYIGVDGRNPIADDQGVTDPVIRFFSTHLDTFSWPTWEGFESLPVARVAFDDPHLGTPVFGGTINVELDQSDGDPYGYLDPYYDSEFDIAAPAGYALAGWSANGQPFEVGDRVTGDTVLTPLWIDTTAVRSVVITASATEVEAGGSVTMAAEGYNALGDSLGDVTADMQFSSDVPTDEVDGATITFPTASPHVISGTYLPLEITAEPVVVEVLAAEVDDVPVDDVPAEAAGDSTGSAEDAAGGTPVAALAETGLEEQRAPIAAAAVMIALGAGLVALRRYRLG
ncbi:leucine-rich repeat domain-containing protein [Demequina muriae]|uniref:Leucine-rich repeat domain-containing protein n=1 Tax=Demequina muriae TaxID=3051664 RepID=A0ABT8GIX4_9MICO|nr:leucine-rich repeat domain-containing protein [Demequina sp. EGI L300058]MDN4480901.1 leucine-rich repeat domain-containing protein [Demequina sp. EGI L300058]